MAKNVVILGASGAVGSHALKALLSDPRVGKVTSLGRRRLELAGFEQKIVDVLDPSSYRSHLPEHEIALCTLGVGQPSQMSREEFLKVDRDAVLAFARACKQAGIRQFSLLCAV